MNGYDLTRRWYNFKFENPDKVKSVHSDLYFYTVDLWNRLGQKEKFGLPTLITMENLGIGSRNTYYKVLKDIIEWGFIIMVSDSKNQHQSRVVALSKIEQAPNQALDQAHIQAREQASEQTPEHIIEQITKNNRTNKQIPPNPQGGKKSINKKFTTFDFKKTLKELGVDNQYLDDWIKVRKNKKTANTKTALERFLKECENNDFDVPEAVKICAEKNWAGFKFKWLENEKQNFKYNQNGNSKSKSEPTINRQTAETIRSNSQGW